MSEWRSDVLGEGFECLDLDLGKDDEGPLLATLVRALPEPRRLWDRFVDRRRPLEGVRVLYVHGWSDYFFQRGLAKFWTDRGAHFYALDLRKYGRSLRPGQTHGYIEDLADYDTEINLAIEEMRRSQSAGAGTPSSGSVADSTNPVAGDGHPPLVLLGHSTGGLVLSLWADRHRGVADALILNSPWLDLQVSGPLRAALTTMVNMRARLNPHELALPRFDLGFYHEAQRRIATAEEQAGVNIEWRPEHSFPIRSGWLKAIIAGHARVAAGIDVGAPVCTLLATRSHFGLNWRDEMLREDTVIEVEGVARAALRLGRSVTVERIEGALHDVFLSQPEARSVAYEQLDGWLAGWAAREARRASSRFRND